MPYEARLELAGDDALAHPVEEGESGMLAARPQEFGECRGKRRFGQNLRLDPGRDALRPGLALALQRRQPLFFSYQCVDVADAPFHLARPPSRARRIRSNPTPLFNVPLSVLAQLKCDASRHCQKS